MNKIHPVVFFVFKRPDRIVQFLDSIVSAGTKRIYIFADGPRHKQDKELTDLVKKKIKSFIQTHPKLTIYPAFSSTNKGLKRSIIDGLHLVFSLEEAAIILEDDCLPHPDFFTFCNKLLTKYLHNPAVFSISGFSHEFSSQYSYDFSKYPQCWGWATWARAWKKYDEGIVSWDDSTKRKSILYDLNNIFNQWFWKKIFEMIFAKRLETWDYQLTYSHLAHKALSIIPKVNLISNIGFDSSASNTKWKANYANKETKPIDWPLVHPKQIVANKQLDDLIISKHYISTVPLFGLFQTILKGILR